VRLDTCDPVELDRLLGTTRQTLIGRGVSALVLDLGPATLDRSAQSALMHWTERHRHVLRSHLEAMVMVAPTWASSILMRLSMRGKPPPMPYVVVRRLEDGLAWLAARHPRAPC
jgi:hypothetical protein